MTAFIVAATALVACLVAFILGDFNGVSIVVCIGALGLIGFGVWETTAPTPDVEPSVDDSRLDRLDRPRRE